LPFRKLLPGFDNVQIDSDWPAARTILKKEDSLPQFVEIKVQ
jgi:hypothetical protein